MKNKKKKHSLKFLLLFHSGGYNFLFSAEIRNKWLTNLKIHCYWLSLQFTIKTNVCTWFIKIIHPLNFVKETELFVICSGYRGQYTNISVCPYCMYLWTSGKKLKFSARYETCTSVSVRYKCDHVNKLH